MPLFHLILVALIQGITEFLPVSSSGHLILLPRLTGLEDQGQVIDVAVHFGTLGAVVLYFVSDVRRVVAGLPNALRGRFDDPGARLAGLLAIATVPVVVAGLVLNLSGLDDALRSVAVIGWAMLGFGVVLWIADRFGDTGQGADDWSVRDALILGLWQAVALIPGTSRSGITITGARFLGYERSEAARIAMLMSIPTILASATLLGLEVLVKPQPDMWRDIAIAAGLAFVAALGALAVMFRLLKFLTFTPYVVYRILLGGLLLWIAYA